MWTGTGMRSLTRGAILAGVKILAAELLTSAAAPEGFPAHELPEVAIVGRSNVGKSSLINRMTARRSLARTSATPGKTRLLNFFRIVRPEGALVLVDLPGYGYAKVSREERRSWQALVERYLARRRNLRLALLLQDVRRDPGADEIDFLPWLAARGVPVLGAATKVDRLSARERAARLAALARAGLPIEWLPTSGRTGEGVEALWQRIDAALAEGPSRTMAP
jgi:GTP-binding protein